MALLWITRLIRIEIKDAVESMYGVSVEQCEYHEFQREAQNAIYQNWLGRRKNE